MIIKGINHISGIFGTNLEFPSSSQEVSNSVNSRSGSDVLGHSRVDHARDRNQLVVSYMIISLVISNNYPSYN